MTDTSQPRNPELVAWENLATEIRAELAHLYLQLHPDKDLSHFLAVYKSLYLNSSVNGDDAIAQIEAAQDEGQQATYFNTALVVSSSYLAEAQQEAERGRIGRAWYGLARACYWCGVLRSQNEKIDFTLQATDAIRAAEGARGGQKRAAKYHCAKQEVIKMAHFLRPEEGWEDCDEAGEEISAHVLDLASENPTRIAVAVVSVKRSARTFSDWLGDECSEEEFRHLFPRCEVPSAILDKKVERASRAPDTHGNSRAR